MKKTIFLVALLVVFGLVGAASGSMYVSSDPLQDTAAVEAYWTPERMQSAVPYPMGIDGEPTDPDPAALEEEADAMPGSSTSSRDGRPSVLLEQEEDVPDSSGLQPASSSYPFPHTTYWVSTVVYLRFPYVTVGKVFFTKRTGGNFVCSGSSVGGRLVLTAGHCVSDGAGRFHINWSFVPAFLNGSRPRSTWTAFKLWTFANWHNRGQFCRDVGFAITNNVSGQKLSQRVGFLGFSWNQNRVKQHWDEFGYPATAPWNGQRMVQTEAEWARNDSPRCSNPPAVGTGSRHRPGSSGGPWVRIFFPDFGGARNFANGVISYFYASQPDGLYSPYFDTAVRNLWNSLRTR